MLRLLPGGCTAVCLVLTMWDGYDYITDMLNHFASIRSSVLRIVVHFALSLNLLYFISLVSRID